MNVRPLFGSPAILLPMRTRGFASPGYPGFAIYREVCGENYVLKIMSIFRAKKICRCNLLFFRRTVTQFHNQFHYPGHKMSQNMTKTGSLHKMAAQSIK